MALSADQRAMLELLLGRGQSYDDISSLLGTPADEVRSKARWALAELGGADPDRNVALSDYLLGQADPIGRADAVRHLRDDVADRALAERLIGGLQEIAPSAELPSLPSEGRTAPHLRAPSLPGRPAKERAPKPPREPVDPRRARFLMGLASAGVILVIVVLAIAGAFSGSGTSGASTTDTATTPATTTTTASGSTTTTGGTTSTPKSETITPLKLTAVGGGPGSGVATFGLANGSTPFLDLRVSKLPAPGSGQVYAAWLVVDPQKRLGYPLAPLVPYPPSGDYHNSFPVPSPAVPLLSGIQAVEITTAPASVLAKKIRAIAQQQKPKLVLPEIGTTVLRAAVPRGSGTPSGSTGGGTGGTPSPGSGPAPTPNGGGSGGAGASSGK